MKTETKQDKAPANPRHSYFTAYNNGEAWLFGLKRFDTADEASKAKSRPGEIVMVTMANEEHAALRAVAEVARQLLRTIRLLPGVDNEITIHSDGEHYKTIRDAAETIAALETIRSGRDTK